MKASLNSEPSNPSVSRLGRYQLIRSPGEHFRAYLPPALPPDPAVRMDRKLDRLAERALREQG